MNRNTFVLLDTISGIRIRKKDYTYLRFFTNQLSFVQNSQELHTFV